ncbi:hypothetical protein V5O48_004397 [Marasmius crinis-equi]|uniref:F-box domain-containing protein n=1 Tax=Marasmius crinis-equi TaxID=585013 RepID=A0ABR3FQA2_9AGAR
MASTVTPTPTVLCRKCDHTFAPLEDSRPLYEPVASEALHSNCVPTDAEVHRAINLLRAEEDLLAQYDEELDRIRAMALKLKAERDALQRRIVDRRYSISSIKRIPVELWHRIFSLVCSAHEYTLAVSRRKVKAPTWRLSLVCHHWREIVVQLPHLWSSISVDILNSRDDIGHLLLKYLEHAKDAPLTLRIEDPNGAGTMSSDSSSSPLERESYLGEIRSSVFRTLMNQISRCRILELNFDSRLFSLLHRTADSSTSLSFPHLHTFCNNMDMSEGDSLTEYNRWFWDAIKSNAPRLSDVQTSDQRELHLFPCSQLKFLQVLHVDDVKALFHTITSAPDLRTLIIDDVDDLETTTMEAVPVVSSIRDLTIFTAFESAASIANLFSLLTLPSLKSITLKCDYGLFGDSTVNNHDWALSFVEMLRRSSANSQCSVKKIYLDVAMHASFPDDFLLNVVQHCPKLTHLELELYPVADPSSLQTAKLLSELTVSASEGEATTSTYRPPTVLAPKLKKLLINESVQRLTLEEAETFLRMAESRSGPRVRTKDKGISTLTKATLSVVTESPEDVEHCNVVFESRLQALEKAGTKCVIRD